MATHSTILTWRIPWTEEHGWVHTVHRVTQSQTRLMQLSTHITFNRGGYDGGWSPRQTRLKLVLTSEFDSVASQTKSFQSPAQFFVCFNFKPNSTCYQERNIAFHCSLFVIILYYFSITISLTCHDHITNSFQIESKWNAHSLTLEMTTVNASFSQEKQYLHGTYKICIH